jgi:UDP-3-O-[3-hydroxymyristoyl] glucosamine N-acyltransferase
MMTKVRAHVVAQFLNKEMTGEDIEILGVCSLENIRPNCMMFVEHSTPELWALVSNLMQNLVICLDDLGMSINGPHIVAINPRLSFIFAAREFFMGKFCPLVDPTAKIHPQARIGRDVSIGAFCVIDKDVAIGDSSTLSNNVVVTGKTTIGKNCLLKSNSVIGEDGFGFCMDEHGTPHATPHFGGILIGDSVWIGANCTIERGIFDDTIVEDHVKVDDLVQIGHNSRIGRGTRLAAGTIVCGNVKIEPECWIGPNSNLIERKTIGRGSLIGIGTNVLSDIPPGAVFVGNPGKKIRDITGK